MDEKMNTTLVEAISLLLEQAKAGELEGFAYISTSGSQLNHGWHMEAGSALPLVGALQVLLSRVTTHVVGDMKNAEENLVSGREAQASE